MARIKPRRKAQETRSEPPMRLIRVEDPGELAAGGRVYPEPGQRIEVVQSLRDDPLGRMHCRGQIDDAQYHAGRDMQAFYERAEIGNLKAMDTTKEPVDGGGIAPEVLKDGQLRAVKEIIRLERALGMEGSVLVRQVLGGRMFIEQIAEQRGIVDQLGRKYLGRRFRECLETLARELRYA